MLKRQGDILLEKIDAIPELTNRSPGFVEDGVIARGEVTGHAHVLKGASLYNLVGKLYAVAEASARVEHDEHDALELEPGVWLVHNQTEYVSETERTMVHD